MLLLANATTTETSLLRDSKIKARAPVKSTVTSFGSEKTFNGQNVPMMPDFIGQTYQRSRATQNIMSLVKKDINLNESSFVLNSRRVKRDSDHTVNNVANMSNDASGKNYTAKVYRTNATKKLYALPPSIFHKQVEKYRNTDCSSVDNFNKEMCHFRPIRLAPISPWKIGVNMPRRGVIMVPKTIVGKPQAKKRMRKLKKQNLHYSPNSAFVLSTRETEQSERRRPARNNAKSACDLTLLNKPNKDSNKSSSSTKKSHLPKRSIKQAPKRAAATKKSTSCPSSSPPLTRSRLRELRKKNLPNSLQYFGLL